MSKNLLEKLKYIIKYDNETGTGGAGGAGGAGAVETQPTDVGGSTEDNTEVTDTTEDNTGETGEVQEKEEKTDETTFDPAELDLTGDSELDEIDTKPFEKFCQDYSIKSDDPELKKNIAFMNEIGLTHEQQEKMMRAAQERVIAERKAVLDPVKIKKAMRENLTPEQQADYTPIANAFKTMFKDNPELYELAKSEILANPTTIKVLSMFKKHIEGKKGVSVNPTPAKNSHAGTLSYEQGVKKYNDAVADMLRKGEKVTPKTKQAVLDKISSEVKLSDLTKFKDYLK